MTKDEAEAALDQIADRLFADHYLSLTAEERTDFTAIIRGAMEPDRSIEALKRIANAKVTSSDKVYLLVSLEQIIKIAKDAILEGKSPKESDHDKR